MEGQEKNNWARKHYAKSTSGQSVPGPRLQGMHADIHLYKHTAEQGLTDTRALLTFTHVDISSFTL